MTDTKTFLQLFSTTLLISQQITHISFSSKSFSKLCPQTKQKSHFEPLTFPVTLINCFCIVLQPSE